MLLGELLAACREQLDLLDGGRPLVWARAQAEPLGLQTLIFSVASSTFWISFGTNSFQDLLGELACLVPQLAQCGRQQYQCFSVASQRGAATLP